MLQQPLLLLVHSSCTNGDLCRRESLYCNTNKYSSTGIPSFLSLVFPPLLLLLLLRLLLLLQLVPPKSDDGIGRLRPLMMREAALAHLLAEPRNQPMSRLLESAAARFGFGLQQHQAAGLRSTLLCTYMDSACVHI